MVAGSRERCQTTSADLKIRFYTKNRILDKHENFLKIATFAYLKRRSSLVYRRRSQSPTHPRSQSIAFQSQLIHKKRQKWRTQALETNQQTAGGAGEASTSPDTSSGNMRHLQIYALHIE